ncbi:hypothetical protein NDU88_005893 [Pleurodeles waltl]|uniref:Uncharacterized protein n=1 Tax=Pleurodeles waltl TaxID=8319 RepID=A0AAV7LP20_PLEWA|nr:hypothetical protein NDU88_005893 [Pleurodeles waltl]
MLIVPSCSGPTWHCIQSRVLLDAGTQRGRRCRGPVTAPRRSPPPLSPRIRHWPQPQASRGHPMEVASQARRAFFVLPAAPPQSASARVSASSASTRSRGRLADSSGDPPGHRGATAGTSSVSSGRAASPRPPRPPRQTGPAGA